MTDRDEVVRQFVVDGHERVEQLCQDLAALEPGPDLLRQVDAVRAALSSVEAICAPPEPAAARTAPVQPDVQVVIASPLGVPADAEAPPVGQLLVERGVVGSDAVVLAVMQQGEGDGRPLGEILVAHGSTTAAHVVEALELQAETKRSAQERSVRVDADLLDALRRGTSALARSRDDVVSLLGSASPAATAAVRQLDHVTEELQRCVATLRSRPVHSLRAPLLRIVRDRGDARGASVRLRLEGGATELDQAVLDVVGAVLAQCVRSAVDHRIESPARRQASGKPVEAQLVVRAARDGDGDRVVVELADDGCGDTTAGRGLELVTTDVERLGGRVDVVSVPGRGTTVRIVVPQSCPVRS